MVEGSSCTSVSLPSLISLRSVRILIPSHSLMDRGMMLRTDNWQWRLSLSSLLESSGILLELLLVLLSLEGYNHLRIRSKEMRLEWSHLKGSDSHSLPTLEIISVTNLFLPNWPHSHKTKQSLMTISPLLARSGASRIIDPRWEKKKILLDILKMMAEKKSWGWWQSVTGCFNTRQLNWLTALIGRNRDRIVREVNAGGGGMVVDTLEGYIASSLVLANALLFEIIQIHTVHIERLLQWVFESSIRGKNVWKILNAA